MDLTRSGKNGWSDFTALRGDKRGSHDRPHKPVLLLAIIDLLDRKVVKQNAILLSDELVASFKRHFDVVRGISGEDFLYAEYSGRPICECHTLEISANVISAVGPI